MAGLRSSILDWPNSPIHTPQKWMPQRLCSTSEPVQDRCWGPWATWHLNRCAACPPIPVVTFSPSVPCFTKCCSEIVRSEETILPTSSVPSFTLIPLRSTTPAAIFLQCLLASHAAALRSLQSNGFSRRTTYVARSRLRRQPLRKGRRDRSLKQPHPE